MNTTREIKFNKELWPRSQKEINWVRNYIYRVYGTFPGADDRKSLTTTLFQLEENPKNKDVIRKIKAAWSSQGFRSNLKKENKLELSLVLKRDNYKELNEIALNPNLGEGTSIDDALKYLLEHHRQSQTHLTNETNKLIHAHKEALEDLVSKQELIDSQNQLKQYKEGLELLWKTLRDRTRDMHTANIKNQEKTTLDSQLTNEAKNKVKEKTERSFQKDIEKFKDLKEVKALLQDKS